MLFPITNKNTSGWTIGWTSMDKLSSIHRLEILAEKKHLKLAELRAKAVAAVAVVASAWCSRTTCLRFTLGARDASKSTSTRLYRSPIEA